MIIDAVKKFFETKCDLLVGKKLAVNMLGEKAHSCTIETVPCVPIIRKYADGGSLRQFVFVIATREYFDKATMEQLNTNIFYEQLAEWIEQCNTDNTLPELEPGKRAIGWEILSGGYLYDVDAPKARYQIQLRLIYEKA